MWLILQQDDADDSVLATNENHSARELIKLAFAYIGATIVWRGSGVEEKAIDRSTGDVLVEGHPGYFRPTEVDRLLDDPTKARNKLGWHHKTSFDQLVQDMVEADMIVVPKKRERLNRGS